LTKTRACISIELGEGKIVFVKNNITRYINPTTFNIKAFESFMQITIAKEYTLLGSEFKLSLVIRSEMRPTGTSKNPERGVIGFGVI
jgi:hypothetical protein